MNKFYFLILFVVIWSCRRNSFQDSYANTSLVTEISIFNSTKLPIDSILINNFKNQDLKLFYKNYSNQTVWDSKSQREYILSEISNAGNEGLEPEDYEYKKLKLYEDIYENLQDSSLVKYDLLLTKNLQLYTSHICKGKLDPRKLYDNWDLKTTTVDVNKILFDAISNDKLASEIEKCKPNHLIYKKLKQCLKILNSFPKDSVPYITIKDKLLPNKKNKAVIALKKRLMYWHDLANKDTLTNIYDKETQDAVKVFQQRHGLKPDAVIGKSTVEALNFSRNQRLEQVIVNMERWRWFSRDFGNHYLLINIPDYSVVAIKDKDTTQTQRVVVGKESRPTPILDSKISNINLNPNWTVPPTILKEDIYPEAIKNKGVFRQKGLTIFDKNNNEVNPSTWNIDDANKYKYVQNPSRNNSLGSMKINFLNKYSVYLHDTNHRNFFAFTYRSLSSGCVRLEKPLEMATYIINDTTKWSLQRIKDTTDISHYYKLKQKKEEALAKKNAKLLAKYPLLIIEKKTFAKPELKTIYIKINEDIFIHQLYWTAWETNGKLQFREDIYCLDSNLYSKLRY
ncbi:MAG: L,D-transpeptidase family protein [Flavobacterium sp.]|nr:L,D-transpeptidase family protein [Flavobacterium sp.]